MSRVVQENVTLLKKLATKINVADVIPLIVDPQINPCHAALLIYIIYLFKTRLVSAMSSFN